MEGNGEPADRYGTVVGLNLAASRGELTLQSADPNVHAQPIVLSDDASVDRWVRRHVRTSHHISGTYTMGPDTDADALVDEFGRVRGVDNLRVADPSIMHDCVRANTNFTVIMIGERIADFMR